MPTRLSSVAFWLGFCSTGFTVTNAVVMENGRDLSDSIQGDFTLCLKDQFF